MKLANEISLEFVDTFYDQYGEPQFAPYKVRKWSEEKARKFVIDHISSMIAINGDDGLWYIELEAIKNLGLHKELGLNKTFVRQSLQYYEDQKVFEVQTNHN